MSLRARLTLAGGGAVLAALLVASLVIYFDVRSNLRDQIDFSLIQNAQGVAMKAARIPKGAKRTKPLPGADPRQADQFFPVGPSFGSDSSGYVQIVPNVEQALKKVAGVEATRPGYLTTVTPGSKSGRTPFKVEPDKPLATLNAFVPLTGRDVLVADGLAPAYFRTATYRGQALAVYAMRLSASGDGLILTARPLAEADSTLNRVRWLLVGLTLGGAGAAALIGWLAAAAVLRPVRSLAGAVRDVTATRGLDRRVPVAGRDEVASLASDFNAMMAALEESQRAQQQLIADASHELRTPLTAHRTNVELLARSDLPAERRPHVLAGALRGIEELSSLINDLIAAARNGRAADARTTVALDETVAAAVERARRRAPTLRFEQQLDPYAVAVSARRVERAVDNVLDNAVKWSPAGATVQITLADGLITVRDHGPGIDPADLPHVLDRFYRAAAARGLPGSGLGLAIVKQAVDDHHGSISVDNAPGGGVTVSLRFDTTAVL